MHNNTTVNAVLIEAHVDDEITLGEYLAAKYIKFDINDEDVALFIQSVRNMCSGARLGSHATAAEAYLRNISRIRYADESGDYDGAYVLELMDGTQKKLGWWDSDRIAVVYPMD